METRRAIPAQWSDYDAMKEVVPHVVPDAWYGVCSDFSDEGDRFSYLCGVEVTKRGTLPDGQVVVEVPAGRYARFATKGHISTMNGVWEEVYSEWLGSDGIVSRPGASIEYYPPEFDGRTGDGGFEVWIAVE
jgi:AraC family transcriptional regulator